MAAAASQRFKKLAHFVILGSLISSFAQAAPKANSDAFQLTDTSALDHRESPQPSAPNLAQVPKILINPNTLRQYLINNSVSALSGLNSVYQAKEAVNIARGNVLPSISLQTAVSAVTGFGLTSVTALVPFLIPSNWTNLDASQHQLAASGLAFYLAELNSYASAYGLYITILSDSETLEILRRQAKIYKEIEMITADQVRMGSATVADLKIVSSQTKSAVANGLKLKELIASEKAQFRAMLSLPQQKLVFEPTHIDASPQDNWPVEKVLTATYRRSPEARQILSLIEASKSTEWSSVFSFLSGVTLSLPNDESGKVAFSNYRESTTTVSAGIGFGYPATIRLSSLNTEALRLRLAEIKLEQTSAIETTMASLTSAFHQAELTKNAEADALAALNEQMANFRQGLTSLLSIKDAANNLLTLGIARVAARADLDYRRLSLNRIFIRGEFARIPTCEIQTEQGGIPDVLGWLPDFFDPSATKITVDQLCRAPGAGQSGTRTRQ